MSNPTRGPMGGPLFIWRGTVTSDRHLFGLTTGSKGDSIAAYMPDNSVFPPRPGIIAYPDCIVFHSLLEDQKVKVTVEEWDRTPPPFNPKQTEWRLAGEIVATFSETHIRGDCLVLGPSDFSATLEQGPGKYRARAWTAGTDEALAQQQSHAALYSYNETFLLQLWPVPADENEDI